MALQVAVHSRIPGTDVVALTDDLSMTPMPREELLAKARLERAQRAEIKRHVKAAVLIQRRFRYAWRHGRASTPPAQWLARPHPAQRAPHRSMACYLPAGSISDRPPNPHRRPSCWYAAHIASHTSTAHRPDRVVPPILMAYAPTYTTTPSITHPPLALRGCVSVLLRSMGTGAQPAHDYRSAVPLHQGVRVVTLCCAMLGHPRLESDVVLQLAAVQCLKKLCDESAWQDTARLAVHATLVHAVTSTGLAAQAAGRLLRMTARDDDENPMSPHAKLLRRLRVLAVQLATQCADAVQWVDLARHVLPCPALTTAGVVPSLSCSAESFAQLALAVPMAAGTLSQADLLWCFANLSVVAGRCVVYGATVRHDDDTPSAVEPRFVQSRRKATFSSSWSARPC